MNLLSIYAAVRVVAFFVLVFVLTFVAVLELLEWAA